MGHLLSQTIPLTVVKTIYNYLDVIVNISLFSARHLNLDGQFKCLVNGIEGIA